ncbi:PREDICTED: disintegrin and metalloproteinase domain-containing protein 11 [Tinamus guttatus]|uniref:disintegrin and metalloproteinase domain-containing protein 11 n=1 Tax=Tinamus guttatus TaxID=94827 RepID=UPI00052EF37A|nr:PREDICTED: disintegrin and metalloproteinase domain-containing protein 11 [Tinamus guttatus]
MGDTQQCGHRVEEGSRPSAQRGGGHVRSCCKFYFINVLQSTKAEWDLGRRVQGSVSLRQEFRRLQPGSLLQPQVGQVACPGGREGSCILLILQELMSSQNRVLVALPYLSPHVSFLGHNAAPGPPMSLRLLTGPQGPAAVAAHAGALQRRFPRAGWQDGRLVSQITHPSRLVGQSSGGEVQKHQLDTRVRNEPGGGGGGGGSPAAHLARVSFVVHAFGSAFTLDLQLNQVTHTFWGDTCISESHTHTHVRVFRAEATFCGAAVRRAQHTVHSETKYIELAVVNDHQLGSTQGGVPTSNFAKSIVNLADMIYKEQLNTRIVLVAMETWAAEDKIRVEEDSLETLAQFMKYRREALPEPSDSVQLFYRGRLHHDTKGSPGTPGAPRQRLCCPLAGECRCPDIWLGCIMEDTGYYLPRKFSRCSIDEYNQFLQVGGGSCLFNKPLKLLDPPECGNGFVEGGEGGGSGSWKRIPGKAGAGGKVVASPVSRSSTPSFVSKIPESLCADAESAGRKALPGRSATGTCWRAEVVARRWRKAAHLRSHKHSCSETFRAGHSQFTPTSGTTNSCDSCSRTFTGDADEEPAQEGPFAEPRRVRIHCSKALSSRCCRRRPALPGPPRADLAPRSGFQRVDPAHG